MIRRASLASMAALWMAGCAAEASPAAEPSTPILVTYSGRATPKGIEAFEASIAAIAGRSAERSQLSRTMFRYSFPGVLTAEVTITIRRACGGNAIVCECCESGVSCTTGTGKRLCP